MIEAAILLMLVGAYALGRLHGIRQMERKYLDKLSEHGKRLQQVVHEVLGK